MLAMVERIYRKIGRLPGLAIFLMGSAALITVAYYVRSWGWTDPWIVILGITSVSLLGVFFGRMSRWCRRRENLFVYFFACILIAGNLGTLITLGQFLWGGTATYLAVLKSLATYTIAIAATSFADRLVQQADSQEKNRTELLRYFLLGLISVGAGVIVLYCDTVPVINYAIIASAASAALLWFIVNIDHPNLVKDDAFDALGGGNPMRTI
jgi:hypothetical protein